MKTPFQLAAILSLGLAPCHAQDASTPIAPSTAPAGTQKPVMERASADTAASAKQLGPLAELEGKWRGSGFNIIALPDKQNGKRFRVQVNVTKEEFEFTKTGIVPNRGNVQGDIDIFGLNYVQRVFDRDTSELLHIEPGQWLYVPATTAPPLGATVVRMSTIPHGVSLLAQGDVVLDANGNANTTFDAKPPFGKADATPFFLNDDGTRRNDESVNYLAPYRDAKLPPGLPEGTIMDPNLMLKAAVKDQTFRKFVTLFVNADPVGQINGAKTEKIGGLLNIPFLLGPKDPANPGDPPPFNANSNSMSAIFWIEWVLRPNGTHFLQLQYTQTVILDFPVAGPDGKIIAIKWPHISVGTLIKE